MQRFPHRLSVPATLLVTLSILTACAPSAPTAPAGGTSAPSSAAPAPYAPAAAPTPPPTQAPVRPLEAATVAPAAKPAASPAAAPGASPAAQAQGKRGGNFTEAVTADAKTFHPFQSSDSASGGYQALVYAGGLWDYDPDTLQPRPEAATSWTISDDKLTYTFTLRDDLKWSDGQPMTSADYKWTFEQAAKPENKYPYISNLELIESYQAPDPRTIVVKMKEAIVVGLEAANAVTPLPKHVWEKLDWSDPSKNPEIMKPSVVSGRFKLREWKRDDRAIFEANDLYYDGRPLLDAYTVRVVPSQEIAYQMLKSGEVDEAPITPDNYPEAKRLPNLTMYEWWPPAASWGYLGFNLRRPTLQDVQVRRAISHAIDRNAIASQIQNNLAQPTYSVFPPSSWVYNPNVPKYEFDQDKARELLEAAGWKVGQGGIRQKDGKPLKLRVLFGPNTSKVRQRISEVAQQWLREVGIDSEIQGLEWGAYLDVLKAEPYDWDICVLGWNATIEPHWMNQIWREDSIPPEGDLNSVAYINKRVEQLFEQGVKEFDFDKRKQIYQEIQQIISSDAPYIFLTYNMSYVGINNRIGGIEVKKTGISHNLEKWYVK